VSRRLFCPGQRWGRRAACRARWRGVTLMIHPCTGRIGNSVDARHGCVVGGVGLCIGKRRECHQPVDPPRAFQPIAQCRSLGGSRGRGRPLRDRNGGVGTVRVTERLIQTFFAECRAGRAFLGRSERDGSRLGLPSVLPAFGPPRRSVIGGGAAEGLSRHAKIGRRRLCLAHAALMNQCGVPQRQSAASIRSLQSSCRAADGAFCSRCPQRSARDVGSAWACAAVQRCRLGVRSARIRGVASASLLTCAVSSSCGPDGPRRS